jgi:uncharacterized protein YjbJ (UPF0337 family)
MSWLDKLLGRGKKTAGETTGESSMGSEGMHQEQGGMASEGAQSAEQAVPGEGERPTDRPEHSDGP